MKTQTLHSENISKIVISQHTTDVSSSPETESIDVGTALLPPHLAGLSFSEAFCGPCCIWPPANLLPPAPHTLHAPNSPLFHLELVSCQIVKPMRTGTLSF